MSARAATRATGTLEDTDWVEANYSEVEDGPKLAHATLKTAYTGDLEGNGALHYLMEYDGGDGGTGIFVGLEQVTGRLGERSGTFVLRHTGTFEDGGTLVKNTMSIVPNTGTGELAGLSGEGSFVARSGETAIPYTLDYEIG